MRSLRSNPDVYFMYVHMPFAALLHLFLSAPIAWPIAKLLDRVLGNSETHTYKKAELKSFLQVGISWISKHS